MRYTSWFISCITIGDEFEEIENDCIVIEPSIAKEISKGLLQDAYQDKILPIALDSMIAYSLGNIKTAIAYIEQNISDNQTVTFNDAEYWHKMLGKELYDLNAVSCIEFLAIFEYVGYANQHYTQILHLLAIFLGFKELKEIFNPCKLEFLSCFANNLI